MEPGFSWRRNRYLMLPALLVAIVVARSIPKYHLHGLALWSACAIVVFSVSVGIWHASGGVTLAAQAPRKRALPQ